MAVRRRGDRLGRPGAPLCRRGARDAPAGHRLARQRADLLGRGPGRLCHQRRLVAGAQEVPRARAPARALGAARHAARHRDHRRAPPQARRRARGQEAILRSRAKAGMKPYDAVIVGGGHNGLVCAAYLARAGKRVLVLERRERVGGAAMSEEVFPGFRFSVFSYVVSLLRPEIIRELDLPRHGLHILPLESTLTPLPNGDYLAQWNDHDQNRRELARHSLRDAEAYDEFGLVLHQMARVIKPVLRMAPPDPASLHPRELLDLLKLGRHFRDLRPEQFNALWKLLTMSSADYLAEWFETEALKATKSASGIIGTLLGPRSPGTAYVLLHHYMGELDGVFRAWGFAKGGNGSVSAAIAGAAQAFGAEVRTVCPVLSGLVGNGRAVGAVPDGGEEVRGSLVISSADPRRTFLSLVGEKHLPG